MEISEDEREKGGNLRITEIEGDMGQSTRLGLILQPDGDVIVSMYEIREDGLRSPGSSIEFCTLHGGGKHPIIASGLRQIMLKLAEENRKRNA
jgi:hypothetical protein